MIPALCFSLALTLAAELAFALVWGVRGRALALCALVNCMTNPVVVFVHGLFPSPVLTAVLELCALWAEGACYRFFAPDIPRPWLFSLLCNAFSFLLGLLVSQIVYF